MGCTAMQQVFPSYPFFSVPGRDSRVWGLSWVSRSSLMSARMWRELLGIYTHARTHPQVLFQDPVPCQSP